MYVKERFLNADVFLEFWGLSVLIKYMIFLASFFVKFEPSFLKIDVSCYGYPSRVQVQLS